MRVIPFLETVIVADLYKRNWDDISYQLVTTNTASPRHGECTWEKPLTNNDPLDQSRVTRRRVRPRVWPCQTRVMTTLMSLHVSLPPLPPPPRCPRHPPRHGCSTLSFPTNRSVRATYIHPSLSLMLTFMIWTGKNRCSITSTRPDSQNLRPVTRWSPRFGIYTPPLCCLTTWSLIWPSSDKLDFKPDPTSPSSGLLVKKWTSVIRMQKRCVPSSLICILREWTMPRFVDYGSGIPPRPSPWRIIARLHLRRFETRKQGMVA